VEAIIEEINKNKTNQEKKEANNKSDRNNGKRLRNKLQFELFSF
jgi:hypothetical protein